MRLLASFIRSMMAGIMIVIGCVAYISCDNKYVGAALFSVALCAICNLKLYLFTGLVCYVSKARELMSLAVCLCGNAVGCVIAGYAIRMAKPEICKIATSIFENKLEQTTLQTVVLSIFCGILMYIAVHTFKANDGLSRYTGVFTCIPAFIICGFEHSIAAIAYFQLSGLDLTWKALIFILVAIIGNSIGGLLHNTYGGTRFEQIL